MEFEHDFLRLAYKSAAAYSQDPSTFNGAVLVTRCGTTFTGANRFPEGVTWAKERLVRPVKYAFMEHAERDVILQAAKAGVSTFGATMYVPWFACADCARAIICSGVSRVVGHKQMFDRTTERWRETIVHGDAMLTEAGIERVYYDGPIGGVRVLFDGEWWTP